MSGDEYISTRKYRIRERIIERQSIRVVADGRVIREYSDTVITEREGNINEFDIRNYLDLGVSILNSIKEDNISEYRDRSRIDLQSRRNLRRFSIEKVLLSDIYLRRTYVQLSREIRNRERFDERSDLDKVLNNVVNDLLRDLKRRSRTKIEDRNSSIF